MELKTINNKNYKLHFIKNNRFKTSKIDIVFTSKISKKNIGVRTFLSNILNLNNKTYNSERKLAIKLEELYKAYYYVYSARTGDCLSTSFTLNFINEEFVKEKKYLENLIIFICDMIQNPNASNKSFDYESFKKVYNDLKLEITSLKENPQKYALDSALKSMDDSSFSALSLIGNEKILDTITPEKLYIEYENLINNSNIDIFLMGNFDENKIEKLFKKYFNIKSLCKDKIAFEIHNKKKKRVKHAKDVSSFLQTQLICIYNLNNLSKIEKEITVHLFNYIFGSGGLTSKLYQYIREEKNYCYGVSSNFYRFDNLFTIGVSLSKNNVKGTLKLINRALKEMQSGDFSEEELKNAKDNMKMNLTVANNSMGSILRNIQFNIFFNSTLMSEKILQVDSVSKKDIINLANKLIKNTEFTLYEGNNENN